MQSHSSLWNIHDFQSIDSCSGTWKTTWQSTLRDYSGGESVPVLTQETRAVFIHFAQIILGQLGKDTLLSPLQMCSHCLLKKKKNFIFTTFSGFYWFLFITVTRGWNMGTTNLNDYRRRIAVSGSSHISLLRFSSCEKWNLFRLTMFLVRTSCDA